MDIITELRRELEELYDYAQVINQTLHKEKNSLPHRKSFHKRWLTNNEAMSYLGVSKSTIQRYRRSGKLPYSKIGGKLFYKTKDIEILLDRNQVEKA